MPPLSPDDLDRMDAAAIRILDRLGVSVPHDEVRSRLVAAGARETSDGKIVTLPPEMVREAVAVAQKSVRLSSVSGEDV